MFGEAYSLPLAPPLCSTTIKILFYFTTTTPSLIHGGTLGIMKIFYHMTEIMQIIGESINKKSWSE